MRESFLHWCKERWRDAMLWPLNLVRELPGRLTRLRKVTAAEAATLRLSPQMKPVVGQPVRLHNSIVYLFDLLGGPELAQYLMRFAFRITPLTTKETAAIQSVLGPLAIRYQDVRIAEGGLLPYIFRLNGGRAFCAWHTIFLPSEGRHTRDDHSLLVHEATHVFQYERTGTAYIGHALYAQRRMGRGAYDYGGIEGLKQGVPYSAFNREAQAQIAQDYFARREAKQDV